MFHLSVMAKYNCTGKLWRTHSQSHAVQIGVLPNSLVWVGCHKIIQCRTIRVITVWKRMEAGNSTTLAVCCKGWKERNEEKVKVIKGGNNQGRGAKERRCKKGTEEKRSKKRVCAEAGAQNTRLCTRRTCIV